MLSLGRELSDRSIVLILSAKEPWGQSKSSVCGLIQSLLWIVGEPEMGCFHLLQTLCAWTRRSQPGRSNRIASSTEVGTIKSSQVSLSL